MASDALARHARHTVDMVPHLDTLTRLVQASRYVVEFGVRTGVSTWAILDGLPPEGRLYSVDIVEPRVPERVRGDERWYFLQGDSRDVELPHTVDAFFIDSSHEYHQTIAELERARIAPLIILHDWNLPDVQDAVRGFCDRAGYRIDGIEESQWGLVWLRQS